MSAASLLGGATAVVLAMLVVGVCSGSSQLQPAVAMLSATTSAPSPERIASPGGSTKGRPCWRGDRSRCRFLLLEHCLLVAELTAVRPTRGRNQAAMRPSGDSVSERRRAAPGPAEGAIRLGFVEVDATGFLRLVDGFIDRRVFHPTGRGGHDQGLPVVLQVIVVFEEHFPDAFCC